MVTFCHHQLCWLRDSASRPSLGDIAGDVVGELAELGDLVTCSVTVMRVVSDMTKHDAVCALAPLRW
jgi:hypothetical protein